jgi:ribosome-binding protein aMBF1 (putative translation factor)
MAKKYKLRMWCQVCGKNTIHETRTIEEKETSVCLKCSKSFSEFSENHPENNQTDDFKYTTSSSVQPDRAFEVMRWRMPPHC